MAVAALHGKSIRPLVDEKDLSGFLDSVTVAASADTAEVTTFGDNDKEYILGQKDATFAFEGLFAASTTAADDIANYLDGSLGGSTKHVITIDVARSTGGRALLLNGDMTAYDIDTPASDRVALSVDVQGSNGYYGGRMLRPLSASTSTGSNSAVATAGTTSAGGTTGIGGLAHLHVTAVGSTFASATFRIQHSTSGSTWATAHTFTAATGVTFQRSTISGTIKEQVRATISSYTATTGADSITAAIAFSRRVRT